MKYLIVRTYYDGSVYAYELNRLETALKMLNAVVNEDVVISSVLLQQENNDGIWKRFDEEVQG